MALQVRVDRDDTGNVEVSPVKPGVRKLAPLGDEDDKQSCSPPKSAMKKSALKGGGVFSTETPTPPVAVSPTKSAMKKSALKGSKAALVPEAPKTPKSALKSAMKGGATVSAGGAGLQPQPPPGPSPKSAMKGSRGIKLPQNQESSEESLPAIVRSTRPRPSMFKMSLDLSDASLWSAPALCKHYFFFAGQKFLWEEYEARADRHHWRKSIKLSAVVHSEMLQKQDDGRQLQRLQRSQSLIIDLDDEAFEEQGEAVEAYEISPLKELLLENKPDAKQLRALLKGLPDRAKWIDATLDATPPPMPTPIVQAVAAVHANIVEVLVEFRADVTAEYQGKSMLKGWIKPQTPLLECVRKRTGRFMGTMLGDKLETMEKMLMEASIAKTDKTPPPPPIQQLGGRGGHRKSIQMACSRGLMLHTQEHPNLKYELPGNFKDVQLFSVQEAKNFTTGESFAIKAGSKIHELGGKDPEAELWNEITVMWKVSHPNIIKLYETFEDETHIFMVFELCSSGELFDRLVHEGSFPEKIVMRLGFQMASAIRHLHQLNICHRNIQPESFLVTNEPSLEETGVKLVDFSTAKEIGAQPMTTKLCTLHYVAPEVITSTTGYNERVDIWSFGVLVYVMAAGVPPFDAENEVDIFTAIKSGTYSFAPAQVWSGVSGMTKEMISKTIVVDPNVRLSISCVMDHPMMVQAEQDGAAYNGPRGHTASVGGNRSKKLIRSAYSLMTEQISDHQVLDLRNMFKELDAGASGMVEITDCRERIKEIVASRGNSKELAAVLSSDELVGKVNYSMVLATMTDRRRDIRREAARAVFNTFDVDRKDNVSLYEIAQALGKEFKLHENFLQHNAVSEIEVQAIWDEMNVVFSKHFSEDKEMTFKEFFSQLPKASLEIGF